MMLVMIKKVVFVFMVNIVNGLINCYVKAENYFFDIFIKKQNPANPLKKRTGRGFTVILL